MTFYDVLGLKDTASANEIDDAYFQLIKFYQYKDSMVGQSVQSRKIHLDDLTLAYETLKDENSKIEYDLYLKSSNKTGQNYWNWEPGTNDQESNQTTGDDSQPKSKRQSQQSQFQHDYSFINDEFFQNWEKRTGSSSKSAQFNAQNLEIDVKITFEESIQVENLFKDIEVQRNTVCIQCNGLKSEPGHETILCYSCKGKGIKKDPLFQTDTTCNTCQGVGQLIQKQCGKCSGVGHILNTSLKRIFIPRFINQNEVIILKEEGHQTIFRNKGGVHGDLLVKVQIIGNKRWRDGNDIYSQHYLSLAEAMSDNHEIIVETIDSNIRLKVDSKLSSQIYEFKGRGINGAKHIAQVQIRMPRNVDSQMTKVIQELDEVSSEQSVEFRSGSRSEFIKDAPIYQIAFDPQI